MPSTSRVPRPAPATSTASAPDLSKAAALVVTVAPTDPGLYRAGRFWPIGETRVSAAGFTAEQLAQLEAEPRLDVQHVDGE